MNSMLLLLFVLTYLTTNALVKTATISSDNHQLLTDSPLSGEVTTLPLARKPRQLYGFDNINVLEQSAGGIVPFGGIGGFGGFGGPFGGFGGYGGPIGGFNERNVFAESNYGGYGGYGGFGGFGGLLSGIARFFG